MRSWKGVGGSRAEVMCDVTCPHSQCCRTLEIYSFNALHCQLKLPCPKAWNSVRTEETSTGFVHFSDKKVFRFECFKVVNSAFRIGSRYGVNSTDPSVGHFTVKTKTQIHVGRVSQGANKSTQFPLAMEDALKRPQSNWFQVLIFNEMFY